MLHKKGEDSMGKSNYLFISLLLILSVILTACNVSSTTDEESDEVTITYWQYSFPAKVEEINRLIEKFEKENPNIKVEAQDFPREDFTQKVAAALNAGQGPDLINLYYGWLPQYVENGYLQEIPESFKTTEEIDNYYTPMVQSSKVNGKYYALPTAVRSLALFWNKELFEKAGLDPNNPPKTWEELIEYSKKITIRKENGQLEQEGFAWEANGQGAHVFREILLRQWGVEEPISADGKTIQWNKNNGGSEAFKYWLNMTKEHKIGEQNFLESYRTAFLAGKAGIMIDGSFNLASLKEEAGFEWGVGNIPLKEEGGVEANFGSFWTHGIAAGVEGKKLEASLKFLEFITSEETQSEWVYNVGELPAAASFANDEKLVNDEIYGPFVKGLENSYATFFVDETKERDSFLNYIDKILLNDAPIDKTFEELIKDQQNIRDEYFGK